MRKLAKLRSSTGVSTQEVERLEREKLELKEKEEKASGEVKQLQKEIRSLTASIKKLKTEAVDKDVRIETSEAHVVALHKQAADLLLEYDRLLEDNQILQNQAFGYNS